MAVAFHLAWAVSVLPAAAAAAVADAAAADAAAAATSQPPCCSTLHWGNAWLCPGCPPTCSICRGSGNRSGPSVPCSSIHWGHGPAAWRCTDCPKICQVTGSQPPPPPPPQPLHPFSAIGAGDVNGPFELNGTYHLFKCCDWGHLIAPSAAGPWTSLGAENSPAAGAGYISGSVTVVDGIPRAVMPLNRGNNPQCCDGPPSNKTWKYPCVANPPSPTCFQSYSMSLPVAPANSSDSSSFSHWQPLEQRTILVNYTHGHTGHGWVQQDPSHAWRDSAPHDPERWLFLGGTSIDGSVAKPNGRPIIEIFGSRAGSDWCVSCSLWDTAYLPIVRPIVLAKLRLNLLHYECLTSLSPRHQDKLRMSAIVIRNCIE